MICCKNETGSKTYTINVLVLAQEWYSDATDADLPLSVKRDTCMKCGKWRAEVSNHAGLLTKREGKTLKA